MKILNQKNMKYFLIAALLFSSTCGKETDDEPLAGLADALTIQMQSEVDNNDFSGTVVLGNSDSVLFEYANGVSDRIWDIKTKADHRFDIASVNKSFFAGLVMIASDEGKLDVRKPPQGPHQF